MFDTNVFVAALRSRSGASFVILNAIRKGLISGAVSQALFLEYVDVLGRQSNLDNFYASTDDIEAVLGVIASQFTPVPIYYRWRPQLSDPDDEMVLECAANASAKFIITFNKKDFLPAATRFGIEILSPREFIRELNLVEKLKQ